MPHPPFNQQITHRQFLDASTRLEYIDLQPTHQTHPIPILFIPGWRQTIDITRPALEELFHHGHRVIAIEHHPPFNLRPNCNFPSVEAAKATTLISLLKKLNLDPADAITHSEGSLHATIASHQQPHLFRNLILIAPIGVSGRTHIPGLTARLLRHLATRQDAPGLIRYSLPHRQPSTAHPEQRPAFSSIEDQRANRQLVAHTINSWHEINAMATFNIHPFLLDLKRHNIHVAIITGRTDKIVPLTKTKHHLSKLSPESRNFGLDAFIEHPYGHELYPRVKIIMPMVEELLR